MGHIERHLKKSSYELVERLFKEWKAYSGCLYDEAQNLINQKLCSMKFNYETKSAIRLEFEEKVGYGYSRRLEKIESNVARVIVIGNNDNYEIVTAYPDLEVGSSTGEYFAFDCEFSGIDYNCKMWKLFYEIYKTHKFDARYLMEKTPSVKISFDNYAVKIKGNKLTVTDSSFFKPKTFEFILPNGFSDESIISMLKSIHNFKEVSNFFGTKTISDHIKECLR